MSSLYHRALRHDRPGTNLRLPGGRCDRFQRPDGILIVSILFRSDESVRNHARYCCLSRNSAGSPGRVFRSRRRTCPPRTPPVGAFLRLPSPGSDRRQRGYPTTRCGLGRYRSGSPFPEIRGRRRGSRTCTSRRSPNRTFTSCSRSLPWRAGSQPWPPCSFSRLRLLYVRLIPDRFHQVTVPIAAAAERLATLAEAPLKLAA